MTELFKALSDESRVRIVLLLSKRELCVCELEACLKLKQSNLSRHLSALNQAGLVDRFKVAQWVHYRISPVFKEKHNQLWKYVLSQVDTHPLHKADEERYQHYIQQAERCGINPSAPSRSDVMLHTSSN